MKRKKYKIRKWVKVSVLIIIFIGIIIFNLIAIYQLNNIEKIETSPAGQYTCKGGLIRVCSGPEIVADYFGV